MYIQDPLSDQEVNEEVVKKYPGSGHEPKWKNAHGDFGETLTRPSDDSITRTTPGTQCTN